MGWAISLRVVVALVQQVVAGSSGRRAVFVAGLEGTGHHFWSQVFEDCAEQQACQKPGPRIANVLFKRKAWFRVAEAWREEDLPQSEGLTVLNTLESRGELSYPYGPAGLTNPMLDQYAKAALDNGDDLKVILMLRGADDIMKSVQDRWNHSEGAMVKSAGVLYDHINAVPRGSLLCVDHGSLPEGGAQVQAFLEAGHEGSALPFDYGSAMRSSWDESLSHACDSDSCRASELAEAMERIRLACADLAPAGFLAGHSRPSWRATADGIHHAHVSPRRHGHV